MSPDDGLNPYEGMFPHEDQPKVESKWTRALRVVRSFNSVDYVAWVFTLVGVMVLVYAVVFAVQTATFRAHADTTQATVVERIPHHDPDDDTTTYSITVEYTVDGHTYRYASPDTSNRAPQLGENVQVYYQPEDPGNAQLGGRYGALLIMLPLGLAAFGPGLGVSIWRYRKRRRATAPRSEPAADAPKTVFADPADPPN